MKQVLLVRVYSDKTLTDCVISMKECIEILKAPNLGVETYIIADAKNVKNALLEPDSAKK